MKLDRVSVAVATAGICTFLNLYTPQAILPTLATQFQPAKASGVAAAGAVPCPQSTKVSPRPA